MADPSTPGQGQPMGPSRITRQTPDGDRRAPAQANPMPQGTPGSRHPLNYERDCSGATEFPPTPAPPTR